MKKIFWKTYRVKFVNVERDLLNIQFFRGFTWEVVEMAQEEAKKLTENLCHIFPKLTRSLLSKVKMLRDMPDYRMSSEAQENSRPQAR